MAGQTKTKMVEGAARLLAQHGLQGTSFSEVLELTGAPRGSVYHHFPEGKDQLVSAAVDLAGARAIALLETWDGLSPVEITSRFLEVWRQTLTRSNFQVGCAVVAVTVAADSSQLLDRTAAVFRSWRARLAQLLEQGGLERPEAFAATLVAASEGAVVMSRAERSMEPFELVAQTLVEQASAS